MLCFRKFPVEKRFMDKWGAGGREYHQFPSDFFYLTVPKSSVGEPFIVSLILSIEKFYATEGCHNFMSKLFCLTVPKNFKEEPFCAVFQNISSSEKLYGYELGGGE